jgi:transcriptional regulator with XRE-family HTH domain
MSETTSHTGGAPVDREKRRRRELGAFLRAQRARISPADVGLPEGVNQRRVPGLRREEVAQLAGVSASWYTWLEQGRDIAASEQVIEALARALRLDPDGHDHLRTLAALPSPLPEPTLPDPPAEIQRMLDAWEPHPAYAIDARFDYLAWNRGYTAVWRSPAELPAPRRNLVVAIFTDPTLRTLLVGWEPRARALLGQFRAVVGTYAGDPRLTQLVEVLRAESLEFRTWWTQYAVREFRTDRHAIHHPVVGRIEMDLFQLRPVDLPSITIVLQTARTPNDKRRLTKLLADTEAALTDEVRVKRPSGALD